jgi:hypothetical protein
VSTSLVESATTTKRSARTRHQLFLHVAGAATLDQLEGGIHLIGAVDGQVDAIARH